MKNQILLFFRKILYLKTYLLWQIAPLGNFSAFILCYHSISNDGWKYGVDEREFTKHLHYLASQYQAGTLNDISDIVYYGRKFQKPLFVITFDDGYQDIYKLRSLFSKYGIHPTVFLLADDRKKINRDELATDRSLLSDRQVNTLIHDGWSIGSHGSTHIDFWNSCTTDLDQEIVDSKTTLERKYSVKIKYFAYPKGRYNEQILALTSRAGYTLGLSMDDGIISSQTRPFVVPRVGIIRNMSYSEFKSVFLPYSVIVRNFIVNKLKLTI